MKVLIVNTADRGGAGKACVRLHLGLRDLEVNSDLLLKWKTSDVIQSHTFTQPHYQKSFFEKFKAKVSKIINVATPYRLKSKKVSARSMFLRQRDKRLDLYSFPDSECDITSSPLYKEADIINLHWVADFLDYESFFRNNDKPVVWTLHDMNPFTGGEHYTERLLGVTDNGFPIERKKLANDKAFEEEVIRLKVNVISQQDNLVIVSPSQWLRSEALNSQVFKTVNVHCIPNAIPSEVYKPQNNKFARELLGLPERKKVILFVADSVINNRKGFEYLLRAFSKIDFSNILLLAIGTKSKDVEVLSNVIQFGPIVDERLMAAAYAAADVFVIPSLMDNLPNTVLESLMCGTPVIGFPVGGISEMVIPDFNGILADEISVEALKKAIEKFLQNSDIYNSEKIRKNAIEKYDLKVQAKAYQKLFKSVLKNHKKI